MDLIYIFIGILVILLIFTIWYISVFNKLKIAIIKVEESFSGIDIALTKRYDVLTKMVDVVKAYVKHEKETLFEVVKLRKNMSIEEFVSANRVMDENKEKINVVVERYPELKANENFKILQKSILDVEEHLQAARRFYNSNVSLYNQLVITFPTCLVARSRKMVQKHFFVAEEEQKDSVKVKL